MCEAWEAESETERSCSSRLKGKWPTRVNLETEYTHSETGMPSRFYEPLMSRRALMPEARTPGDACGDRTRCDAHLAEHLAASSFL